MFNESKNRRAQQKAATSKAVLDAARDEFERVGFEQANLRDIARAAGVSAGTVLHHFGDKRELLHAALFDDLEASLARTLRRPAESTLEQNLGRLTRAVLRFYQRRPTLSRTLLKESLFADQPWASRFQAQTGRTHATIVGWVEQARAQGEVHPGADARLFAVAYLSFFYFALLSWTQGAHRAPARLVDRLVQQHLAGIRPATRRSQP